MSVACQLRCAQLLNRHITGDRDPPTFSCMVGSDMAVPLSALCNGVDDCGPVGGMATSGEDEKAAICDSKAKGL